MQEAGSIFLPIIVSIVAIFASVTIHEFCHGVAAYLQGDTTARDAGRLTLNPISHIDLFGTLIIPGILIISGSPFLIGWAKPVPFDPFRLKNPRLGSALVALAGPLSNIILFVIAGFALTFFAQTISGTNLLLIFLAQLALVNFVLAIFNMIPIPPLDGSKVVFGLLPRKYDAARDFIERNALLFFIGFLVIEMTYPFAGRMIGRLFSAVTNLFGIPL